MFVGNYQHNIDENGRFCIPAQFREELGDSFYAIKGQEGFVVFYSASEFDKRAAALKGASREALATLYSFMTSSEQISQDKQGRAVLPLSLRSYAGISDTIKIVGMIDQIYVSSASCEQASRTPEEIYFDAETALEKKEAEASSSTVQS